MGTALILLAPVLFDIGLFSYAPRLIGLPEKAIVYSSFYVVALGVLFLLIATACSLAMRRLDSKSPSRRTTVREDSGVHRLLRATVVLVVTGFALILGLWSLPVSYFADSGSYQVATLLVLELFGVHILATLVQILYLVLIVAWIWTLVRKRVKAKTAPANDQGQPEDGET